MKQSYSLETQQLLATKTPFYIKLFVPILLLVFTLICVFLHSIKFHSYIPAIAQFNIKNDKNETVGIISTTDERLQKFKDADSITILYNDANLHTFEIAIYSQAFDSSKIAFKVDSTTINAFNIKNNQMISVAILTRHTIFEQVWKSFKQRFAL